MVKQRLSSADIAAEAACLRARLVNMRVSNVYDLSSKSFVFKLTSTGASSREGDAPNDKALLYVDCGERFHTLSSMPPREGLPRPFATKLRKHCRSRRLEAVEQLGADRVLDLRFGSGENACHVLVECFAAGNLVLTDKDYTVLALLRSHRDDEGGASVLPGHPYPLRVLRARRSTGEAELKEELDRAKVLAEGETGAGAEPRGVSGPDAGAVGTAAPPAPAGKKKRGKKSASPTSLRAAVQRAVSHGPAVAEHCCLRAGLDPARDAAASPLATDELAALAAAVRDWERWMDALSDAGREGSAAPLPRGFIVYDPPAGKAAGRVGEAAGEAAGRAAGKASGEAAGGASAALAVAYASTSSASLFSYDPSGPLPTPPPPAPGSRPNSVEPLFLLQHASRPVRVFPTFDDALREFFGGAAASKAGAVAKAREDAAAKKLADLRARHEARLEALSAEAAARGREGHLVQKRADLAEAALGAVNDALAAGMDWTALERVIRDEAEAGNPVAGLIDGLELDKGIVRVKLPVKVAGEEEEEEQDEDEGDEEEEEEREQGEEEEGRGKDAGEDDKEEALPRGKGRRAPKAPGARGGSASSPPSPKTHITVPLLISMSAHANAKRLFDRRRWALAKRQRTVEAEEKSLRAAEAAAAARLRKLQISERRANGAEGAEGAAEADGARAGAGAGTLGGGSEARARSPLAAALAQAAPRGGLWFEPYAWFVTSEGHLVVSATSLAQADELLRVHLGPGDVLVHSEADGAPVTLVKASERVEWIHKDDGGDRAGGGDGAAGNDVSSGDAASGAAAGTPSPTFRLVPPACVTMLSLVQAGAAVLCRSSAWNGKRSGAAAFWVAGRDVSLRGEDGARLGPGAYRLLRPHAWLPAQPLALGLAWAFVLGDAASAARHAVERVPRSDAVSVQVPGERRVEPKAGRPEARGRGLAGSGTGGGDKGRGAGNGGGDEGRATGNGRASGSAQAPLTGGRKAGAASAASPAAAARRAARAAPSPAPSAASSELSASARVSARTARAKAKKARAYADQDDEERELARAALASSGGKKDRAARRAAHRTKLAEKRAAKVAASGSKAVTAEDVERVMGGRFASKGEGENEGKERVEGEGENEGKECGKGEGENEGEEGGKGEGEKGAKEEGEVGAGGDVDEDAAGENAAAAEGRPEGGAEAGALELDEEEAEEGDDDPAGIDAAYGMKAPKAAPEAALGELREAGSDPDPGSASGSDSDSDAAPSPASSASPLPLLLSLLTGAPRREDVVVRAVPVVAPYEALMLYRVRAKLLPGTQKRGKAVRLALDALAKSGGIKGREAELVAAVPEEDASDKMVTGVKVQVAGAVAAAKKKPSKKK